MTTAPPEEPRCRVLLVDDHPIMGAGLAELINAQPDLMVCGLLQTAEHALKAVATLQPDLAVVDLRLKERSGLDLIKDLRRQAPALPTLVLSMHDETLYAERALRAGALGYIMKEEAMDEVLTAIRRVLDGEVYLSKRMATQILRSFAKGRSALGDTPLSRLSDRELDALHLLGQGYSTRRIAAMLHLSVKTVETYRAHLMEKLHLEHATALIRYATQWVTSLDAR